MGLRNDYLIQIAQELRRIAEAADRIAAALENQGSVDPASPKGSVAPSNDGRNPPEDIFLRKIEFWVSNSRNGSFWIQKTLSTEVTYIYVDLALNQTSGKTNRYIDISGTKSQAKPGTTSHFSCLLASQAYRQKTALVGLESEPDPLWTGWAEWP